MQLYLIPPEKRKRNKKNAGNKENPPKGELYTMVDLKTDVKELNLKEGLELKSKGEPLFFI